MFLKFDVCCNNFCCWFKESSWPTFICAHDDFLRISLMPVSRALFRHLSAYPLPCTHFSYVGRDRNQGHLTFFRSRLSQVRKIGLTCADLWPTLLHKRRASLNLLLINTTAALPVWHAFRGMGRASMHEPIIE